MGPSINGRRRLLLLAAASALAIVVDAVTAQPGPGKGPNYFNPNNFNPTMAIVMVVLVTAFFLLGFFSIYLRRCAAPPLGEPEDDGYPVGLGPGLGHRPGVGVRRMRGLDRAVLDSFPTMAYADVRAHRKAGGKGELECAVCLCEFDDDDTLRLLLPRCAHAFHADCIDAWLASHVTCPVCRAVLTPDAAAASDTAAVPASEVVPAAPPDQAVVVVVDAAAGETETETETEEQRVRREEAAELLRIGSVKRALRSKSSGRRRLGPAQFPRSHTTGHSLAAPPSHSPSSSTLESDSERYTLRLPEHVLREAVEAGILRRSASVQTGGARRGFGIARAGAGRSVRLGNSGRWPNMSLLARSFSARLPVWGSVRRGEANAPDKGAKLAGDGGKAVEQCDGGACSLGAHV